MKQVFAFGIALACMAACQRPAEERAVRDRSVGQAGSALLDVSVASGLAAVRSLGSERLVLWASAPGFEFELVAREPLSLGFEVQNAMPQALLTDLETGDVVAVAGAGASPTRKAWQLTLPAGSRRFRLATPDAGVDGPFTFALMSDVQEAIDRVQDLFQRMNAEPGLSFLLGAGDLTRRGTHEELDRYQRELEGLEIPYYTTLGNHELGVTPPPYQEWFGRASFQFVHRGVYFTLLDSGSATIDPIVHEWLKGWLAAGRNAVHVVGMHIPPLDPIGVRNCAFASRGEAAALVADLAEGGVDLTLYGHIHSYYAFDNAGIPAYISGGGGAIPERFDDMGRHFMVFDIDPARGVTGKRVVRID
jgi:hypothetical protein